MSVNIADVGKKRVSLSIGEDALRNGSKQAERENRSFSNYVETLILRDCDRLPDSGSGSVEGGVKEIESGKEAA